MTIDMTVDMKNNRLPDSYSLSRMTRGEQIAKEKVISENADGTFSVPSQTVEEIAYLVRLIDGKYVCNCLDFKFKDVRHIDACKHIFATKIWIASQVELNQKPKPKVFADDSIQCDKCGSIKVIRYGFSDGKQIHKCGDCKHKFRYSLLKKAKYSPETVSLTLDLYFSGMSLTKIAHTLNNQFDMKLGKITIYRWIQKFIPKISEFVNSLSPTLSDTWHADEVFVKMRHGVRTKSSDNVAFLWNVMDRKTRFLLASKLSRNRDQDGATQAFKEAIANAHGSTPETVFTDSLRGYGTPIFDMLPHAHHIARAGIKKPHANNNRIERLNQTIRERTKVQRGFKTYSTPLTEGQRIHYNFVKPHMALENQTPAQRAGLNVESNWLNLLELALSNTRNETPVEKR